MSAFMSFQSDKEICILTDGAGYDKDGFIVTLGRKVTVGKIAPIAVATRGSHSIGTIHQQLICDYADRNGVDFVLHWFAMMVPTFRQRPERGGFDEMHWHICGYSETRGLVRFSAHNMPVAFSDGEEPLRLTQVPSHQNYYAANNASMQTLVECGVRPRHPDERLLEFVEQMGGPLMEAQRRTPVRLMQHEAYRGEHYLVGGQCDMTVVTKDGAYVKTLRTWPDKIGEKINPHGEGAAVVKLPRGQRRALIAEERKLRRRRA